jgi:hypothetical protein
MFEVSEISEASGETQVGEYVRQNKYRKMRARLSMKRVASVLTSQED